MLRRFRARSVAAAASQHRRGAEPAGAAGVEYAVAVSVRYSTRSLPQTPYLPGVSRRDERPAPAPARTAVDLDALARDDDFRYGVDLFNHGFPWEAHEAWEALWQ